MGGDITKGLGYPLRIRVSSSLDFLVSKPQELKHISYSGCANVVDLLTI